MAALFVLVFLVVPLVELYVLIQVGSAIGALNTIALLVVMGVVGGWLMKREGLGVVRRVQAQLQAGRVPATEVVDGFLILFGGALMLTPGFMSDALGLALLIPPVRALVRVGLARRLRARVVGRHGEGRHRRDDEGRGGAGYLDV
ncbi:MAG: FxsA family protein [Actinobacteria bacterium]|nr:FxsA family protein [Actinomycetota bacterium]